ncbi:hypothetical protein D3C81_1262490 [compost metagenome]
MLQNDTGRVTLANAGTQAALLSLLRTAVTVSVSVFPAIRSGACTSRPESAKVRLQLVEAAPPSIRHWIGLVGGGLAPLTVRLTVCSVRTATMVVVLPTKLMGLPPGVTVRLLVPPL